MSIKLSVIMSVYNDELYLKDAIESVLNQTYKNFEFIIIDDGSKDKSLEIIDSYKNSDDRIKVISRENKGLVYSLNEAIASSNGKYIARMDSDDISLKNRFEKQIAVLESYEYIDAVGCDYTNINSDGKRLKTVVVPKENDDILFTLCYSVPFAHPSVMLRKSIFNNFSYENNPTEDYLLWSKIYNGYNFYNIKEVLLLYRYHYGSSFSDSKRLAMIESERIIATDFITNNSDKIFNTLKCNQNTNDYTLRALANIFILYDKKKILKIIFKRYNYLPFIKYVIRFYLRLIYWKYKNDFKK